MFDLIPFEHRNNDLFRYFDDMERAFFGGNTDIAPCKTDILDEGNRFVLKADLPRSRSKGPVAGAFEPAVH